MRGFPGGVKEADTLNNDSPGARYLRRRNEDRRRHFAQPRVSQPRRLELRRIEYLRQIGQLMNDDIRLGVGHGTFDRGGIEHINDHRLCSERMQQRQLGGRTCRADDGMPMLAQPWHKSASNRARSSSEKDPHFSPNRMV